MWNEKLNEMVAFMELHPLATVIKMTEYLRFLTLKYGET